MTGRMLALAVLLPLALACMLLWIWRERNCGTVSAQDTLPEASK